MKNYHLAFYVSEKARTKDWGKTLQTGAAVHGDKIDVVPQDQLDATIQEYDGAINLGMARACKRIMNAYLNAGKHFFYMDKAYLGRGEYWRISIDAWQPLAYFQRFMRGDDRLKRTGQKLEILRRPSNDDKIVLAGACQNYCNMFDLGNVNEHNTKIVENILANSERDVIYRPNPSWARKHSDEFEPIDNTLLSSYETPFHSELAKCHLLVTHGTSAALVAMASGVPVMVLGDGICKPLALGEEDWKRIEEPFWPKDELRYQLFSDVAYCQWSVEEYRSGEAWAEVRSALSYLEGEQQPTSLQDVINQYRMMHQSPKYFRGRSTLNYVDDIYSLVHKTKSNTLLDYGSGKGEQYQRPYFVNSKWGVTVTCYDPGVKKFENLPKGKYDGVICCDVMEHIPEEHVPKTLRSILAYANKFVFFAIATSRAKKILPDGRNCHLTVKPQDWWLDQIAKASQVNDKANLVIELKTVDDNE